MRRLLPYALFAILVCIFLWRPIFTGKALLPGDYLAQMEPWKDVVKAPDPPPQWNPLQWDAIAQFYPWRVFYARSMSQGHIPLWNPHQFCGTPFLANGQSAVLYPLNLVFLVFDPITAFTVFAALHLFLAQVFMYWLMRELGARELGAIVAAIVFAFSAFMVLWLELPTFVGAAVWLPLALLLIHRAVERRSLFYGMLSGLGIAMAVLAGHFQIAFYVAFAAGLWWLWKLVSAWRAEGKINTFLKVVVPLCGCVLAAGLISAPQVLPTVELARNSHRVRDVTPEGYARFVSNSVKPYRLITAFAPDFYGSPSKNNYFLLGPLGDHIGSAADYMEYGMYAGVLPLMLAGMGLWAMWRKRHVGFFALLAVFALLVAAGTLLNAPFYFLIPGFSALGGPNRILLLYLFSVAGLAGVGADYVVEHWDDEVVWRKRRISVAGLLVLGAFALIWGCAVAVAYWTDRSFVRWVTKFASHGPMSNPGIALAFAAACAVAALGLLRVPAGRRAFALLAVTFIVADLFAFGINYNPTCDRSTVYPDTPLTKKLQQLTRNGERIAPINPGWSLFQTPKAILPPNSAMVYGLYDVQGYDSLYTRAYKDLSSEIQGEDSSPIENGNMVVFKRYTPALAECAKYVISQQDLAGRAGISELLGSYDGVNIYRLSAPARSPGAALPGEAEEAYSPFTFRLGLFLMLVGVGALALVGVYRIGRDSRRK